MNEEVIIVKREDLESENGYLEVFEKTTRHWGAKAKPVQVIIIVEIPHD